MHRTPSLIVLPRHVDQFWNRVDFEAPDGCWLWTAGYDGRGYGLFQIRKSFKAHRFAYEQEVGSIPEGLQLDHLCRVKGCVNPGHLEPVTQRENLLRGDGIAAQNARKTHCKHGHPLSGDNLRLVKKGRECRECMRRYQKERRERRG